MIYYTKEGQPTFVPQTDNDRLAVWAKKLSDWRLVPVEIVLKDKRGKPLKDKFGRIMSKWTERVVGTGIAEPTAAELTRAFAKPCRYRRAARASRA